VFPPTIDFGETVREAITWVTVIEFDTVVPSREALIVAEVFALVGSVGSVRTDW
jgi:hypothetical protein